MQLNIPSPICVAIWALEMFIALLLDFVVHWLNCTDGQHIVTCLDIGVGFA